MKPLLSCTDIWGTKERESILYRYEQGGILVYDSRARLHYEEVQEKSNDSPQRTHREIDSALEYGKLHLDKYLYKNMQKYPPFKPVVQEYTLVVPTDKTLRFDSNFESGNLRKAIRIGENEYNLQLEYDIETLGYTQWFYFAVENYKQAHTVRFNIINLIKYQSLYNEGMKPLTYSSKNPGWTREAFGISYFANSIPRSYTSENPKIPRYFFTLSFAYTFSEENDRVYFAHCFPYTYSDLRMYIESLRVPAYQSILSVSPLCNTLANNLCPLITVTKNAHLISSSEEKEKLLKSAAGRRMLRIRKTKQKLCQSNNVKKIVVITGRVHPGESNSSYMVKGLIDFLIGPSKEAKLLRKHYVFKIIPMLNPDGVVYGNYRCSLLGVDLNRRWKKPHPVLHPTVYYAKKLIEVSKEEGEVVMYCDMHGHSVKKEAFVYGCSSRRLDKKKENLLIKMIPFYFSKTNEDFSFKKSNFAIQKLREGTARVVVYKNLEVLNSYTLEASFFGSGSTHFEIESLEKLGKDLALQLYMFINPVIYRKRLNFLISSLSPNKKQDLPKEEEKESEEKDILTIEKAISIIGDSEINHIEIQDQNEDSSGSDSCPSDNDDKKLAYLSRKVQKRRSITPAKQHSDRKPQIPLSKTPNKLRKSEFTRIQSLRSIKKETQKIPYKLCDLRLQFIPPVSRKSLKSSYFKKYIT